MSNLHIELQKRGSQFVGARAAGGTRGAASISAASSRIGGGRPVGTQPTEWVTPFAEDFSTDQIGFGLDLN
jgi:hypothetical protein